MMVVSRQIRITILAAALLITSATFLFPSMPSLEVSVGFADRFHSGFFTPVSVVVRNPDGNLSGELVLEYVSGTALQEGTRYTVRQPVELYSGLTGVYRFTLPLDVSSYPLSIRLERKGVPMVEEKYDLRPMNVPGLLVAGLSRRPSLDSLIIPLTEKYGRPVEMTYPRSEFLPVDPLGWEGVDLVIWHDLPPELPDARSLEALALWLEAGGEILIIAGPWLAGKTVPGNLLPGTVGGPENIGGLTRYSLSSTDSEGEDLVRVVPVGLGRIRYISWDAVHRDVPAVKRSEFWSRILQDDHPVRKMPVESMESLVAGSAFQSGEPLMPPVFGSLIIPLVFLLASGAILTAGRRSGAMRIRIAQLTVLAVLAAGAAAAVYLRDYLPRTDLIVRRLDLLVMGNRGAVHRVNHLSLVSPENTRVDVPLSEGGSPRYSRETNLDLALVNGKTVLKDLELTAWTATEVSVVHTHAGLRTGVDSRPEKVTIPGYRNNSHETWFDPVLVTRGSVTSLGSDWEPGEILFSAGDQDVPENDVIAIRSPESPWTGGFPGLTERLAADLDEKMKIVVARGTDSTVVVHLGESP